MARRSRWKKGKEHGSKNTESIDPREREGMGVEKKLGEEGGRALVMQVCVR